MNTNLEILVFSLNGSKKLPLGEKFKQFTTRGDNSNKFTAQNTKFHLVSWCRNCENENQETVPFHKISTPGN